MARKIAVAVPVTADVQSTAVVDLDAYSLPGAKFKSVNLAGPQTLAAGDISGAALCCFMSTNGAPGTFTTRTAAQMIADANVQTVGDMLSSWLVRITNTGAGAFTLAGGSGVTVTGTATVAQNTYRDFVVTVTGGAAITMQSVATGTYS